METNVDDDFSWRFDYFVIDGLNGGGYQSLSRKELPTLTTRLKFAQCAHYTLPLLHVRSFVEVGTLGDPGNA